MWYIYTMEYYTAEKIIASAVGLLSVPCQLYFNKMLIGQLPGSKYSGEYRQEVEAGK